MSIPDIKQIMIGRIECKIAGCDGDARNSAHGRRGLCGKHYQRLMKYGDALEVKTTPLGEVQKFYQEVVLPYEGDECLIWPYHRNNGGYGIMQGDGKLGVVSRFVCEDRNGPPPSPKYHAAHSCGRGHEGCVTNKHLSWKTPSENAADRLIHGTHNRGERASQSKLTEIQVREILALKGKEPQDKTAARYGTARGTVASIQQRRRWAWLDGANYENSGERQ